MNMEKIISPNNDNEKETRIKEIDDFVTNYFNKYKVGLEASGIGSTQGTTLAEGFWCYASEKHPDYEYRSKDLKIIEKNL